MDDNGKIIGGAFLVGGVVGAVIALLYAPRSGRETRENVSKTIRRISDDAVDFFEETADEVSEFASDLKEKASEIAGQGAELPGRAWKEVISTLEDGQRAIEKRRKRLKKALGI